MKASPFVFAALLAAIIGCGGGGGTSAAATSGGITSTASTTGSTAGGGSFASHQLEIASTSARMEDGAYYGESTFTATKTGMASIEVSSTDIDPMATVEFSGSGGEVETLVEDDDAGGGTTAKVNFSAVAGQKYKLITCDQVAIATGKVTVKYSSDVLTLDLPKVWVPAKESSK